MAVVVGDDGVGSTAQGAVDTHGILDSNTPAPGGRDSHTGNGPYGAGVHHDTFDHLEAVLRNTEKPVRQDRA